LGVGVGAPTPNPQSPIPNPQSPNNIKNIRIIFINYNKNIFDKFKNINS
jgi:hypothetical protein